MKHQTFEGQLQTAFSCGDAGRADCLHAASPRVAQVSDVLVLLRELAVDAFVSNASGHADAFANAVDAFVSNASGHADTFANTVDAFVSNASDRTGAQEVCI